MKHDTKDIKSVFCLQPEYRQFQYFISGAEGDSFAVVAGILTINATLDYEQKNNYTFKVSVFNY